MKLTEIANLAIATLVLTFVTGLTFLLKSQWQDLTLTFTFSIIIITTAVLTKKAAAFLLDADVEHEIWNIQYFGFTKRYHLKKPVPAGIILPIIISILSLGAIKFSALLTYEARALKYRASKRFGFYSYTALTDRHNSFIGASGIIALFILAFVSYFIELGYLSQISIFYAFWNLLPVSKLDGTQIFFGSRVLWAILATIAIISSFFALTTI